MQMQKHVQRVCSLSSFTSYHKTLGYFLGTQCLAGALRVPVACCSSLIATPFAGHLGQRQRVCYKFLALLPV